MTRIPPPESVPATTASPTWTLGTAPWQSIAPVAPARIRVVIDNDFSGDPDDLYQLVHHVLSPSVDIRLVVASHLGQGDPFDPSGRSAQNAEAVARGVFRRMGLDSAEVIRRGAEDALADRAIPRDAPAVQAIIDEALRDDDRRLFYVAGGGLTDLASAVLREPRIADRLTLVWIGGAEHEGLAVAPPGAMPVEYNLLIDPIAAQVVFNDSSIPVWQVPRDVYRQCLVSHAELRSRVAAKGALGRYLFDEVAAVMAMAGTFLGGGSETYALGDSPLVLLTALQSVFEPDSSSSRHVEIPTPALTADGSYVPVEGARPMRVYTGVDTRLMFEDFFLKLAEFSDWQERAAAERSRS